MSNIFLLWLWRYASVGFWDSESSVKMAKVHGSLTTGFHLIRNANKTTQHKRFY